MIVNYSKSESLCQAITKTLNGAHPCSLCKIVTKGKAAENKSDLQSLTQKIDMICPPGATIRVQPFVRFGYVPVIFSTSEIANSPAVPPPRLTAS